MKTPASFAAAALMNEDTLKRVSALHSDIIDLVKRHGPGMQPQDSVFALCLSIRAVTRLREGVDHGDPHGAACLLLSGLKGFDPKKLLSQLLN